MTDRLRASAARDIEREECKFPIEFMPKSAVAQMREGKRITEKLKEPPNHIIDVWFMVSMEPAEWARTFAGPS